MSDVLKGMRGVLEGMRDVLEGMRGVLEHMRDVLENITCRRVYVMYLIEQFSNTIKDIQSTVQYRRLFQKSSFVGDHAIERFTDSVN